MIGQGQVLVVDAGGSMSNCGVFDMNMVQKAQMNGWAGIVINGAVVGGDMLRSSPIGILATGSTTMRCQNNSGHKGGMLNFGNVNFSRGGFVYVDKVRLSIHSIILKIYFSWEWNSGKFTYFCVWQIPLGWYCCKSARCK